MLCFPPVPQPFRQMAPAATRSSGHLTDGTPFVCSITPTFDPPALEDREKNLPVARSHCAQAARKLRQWIDPACFVSRACTLKGVEELPHTAAAAATSATSAATPTATAATATAAATAAATTAAAASAAAAPAPRVDANPSLRTVAVEIAHVRK